MDEIWKDIPEYKGIYQVSSLGRIRNLEYFITEKNGKARKRRARILTNKLPKGARYYQVILFKKGKSKLFRIHRLVALAFLDNPENLPDVNHKDYNKLNNNLENLEWCSKSHNMLHSNARIDGDHGERRYNAKLKDSDIPIIRELIKNKISQVEISKRYGVSRGTIQKIADGKSWKRF